MKKKKVGTLTGFSYSDKNIFLRDKRVKKERKKAKKLLRSEGHRGGRSPG